MKTKAIIAIAVALANPAAAQTQEAGDDFCFWVSMVEVPIAKLDETNAAAICGAPTLEACEVVRSVSKNHRLRAGPCFKEETIPPP
jgi:hypothetical protein